MEDVFGDGGDKVGLTSFWRRFVRRYVPSPDFTVDDNPDNRHPFIKDLLHTDAFGRGTLGEELRTRSFPLIEPGAATFLWHGTADTVWLRHFLSLPRGGFPFEPLIGNDLWHLRLRIPDGTRFEYKIDIGRDGRGEWIHDPLNPLAATDPFGGNSVCQAHGYQAPEWAVRDPAARRGRIERFSLDSAAFGEKRPLGVYFPADFVSGRAYPLVVVHDGFDYVNHASLIPILDTLIHRGDIPPVVAALTQSPDRPKEYVDDPSHAAFISEEVLPALEYRCGIMIDPRQRILMGASLGAVAALSLASRLTQTFAGVVLMSGSFIFDRKLLETRGEVFARVSAFVDSLREDESILRRAFICCGRYEALVTENRRLSAFLRNSGVSSRFVETLDAHHWQNWRDQTRAGLMWCLQPRGTPGAPAHGM